MIKSGHTSSNLIKLYESKSARDQKHNFVSRLGNSPKVERNNMHHRELNMTYIAFGIVVLFFCLNLPRIVIGAYEVSETW